MTKKQTPRVLVVGASGRIGRHLCAQLTDERAVVRAANRRPHALPQETAHGAAEVYLADSAFLTSALRDVDAVFLLWPFFESAGEARRKAAPIAALLGEHVRRVVYLSPRASSTTGRISGRRSRTRSRSTWRNGHSCGPLASRRTRSSGCR